MKTKILALTFCVCTLSSHSQEVRAQDSYQVSERGANHRVWSRVATTTNAQGVVQSRTNAYTEMTTGMHFLRNGAWTETEEKFYITADGAAATNGPHRAYFKANANSTNAVILELPDGQVLRSRVYGLSLFDGSNAVLIAELKNSFGLLVGENLLTYTNCFDGVEADLQYSYTKAGLEQNVVLRSQPPRPEQFGLNPATARLEVLTEFYGAPTPQRRPASTRQDLPDETVDFGSMRMGRGKAFSVAGEARGKSLNVAKQWKTLSGRTFLIEEVPFLKVDEKIQNLKKQTASLKPKPQGKGSDVLVALKDVLQKPRQQAKATKGAIRVASVKQRENEGFVLDYTIMSSATNFTFEAGTFFIRGWVYLSGTTTFNPNCVIKYDWEDLHGGVHVPGALFVNDSVVWNTAAFNMATFTSAGDDSVGETISGSSGNCMIAGEGYLHDLTSTPIQYARFSYTAMGAILTSAEEKVIRHCEFYSCDSAIGPETEDTFSLSLQNVLLSQVITLAGGCEIHGEHVTMDYAGDPWDPGFLGVETASFTNSILTGIDTTDVTLILDHCYTNSDSTGVFQSSAGNDYYLASGSPRINAGTTNIDATLLAAIRWLTTQPPDYCIPDTSAPDLGFHYPLQTAEDDYDGDGLSNALEYQLGTNPLSTDTDGDGVNDYIEWLQGRNPKVSGAVADGSDQTKLRVYTPLK